MSTQINSSDYTTIKAALYSLPATCRYHGEDVERHRIPGLIEACCETGCPSMVRKRALAVLNRLAGVR